MKILGYEIRVYWDNDWEQLRAIWSKKVKYNWYSFTFIRICWFYESAKNHNIDDHIGSKFKHYKFSKTNFELDLGLLGFSLNIAISKY